jgi:hypothetical protein
MLPPWRTAAPLRKRIKFATNWRLKPAGYWHFKSMVAPFFATLIFDVVIGLHKSIRRHIGNIFPAPR